MNMVTAESSIKHYLHEYQRVSIHLAGQQLDWLQDLKKSALANFTAEGFPTVRQEDWKYTNVTPLIKQAFQVAAPIINADLIKNSIKKILPVNLAHDRLVFVNGYFNSVLSSVNTLPTGVTITSLAQKLTTDNFIINAYLDKLAVQNTHAFKQLNTLFMQDGAYIHLPSNTQLTRPIYLLFLSTETAAPHMSTLRNLIIAEENSRADIIEQYIDLNTSVYFTNTLTELYLLNSSQISHYKIQMENTKAFHMGTLEVQQQLSSVFTSYSFALGGGLVRSDINSYLLAKHTLCHLNGFYLASGQQHIDHHTCIDHQSPYGTSNEYYKGVLTDKARAVFNGKVQVAQGAYQTKAQQTNKNLLLSSEAEIDIKPQLEIYADDVQCTHGATIGQLDANALFYLHARGLDANQARNLLIYAFIEELFTKIPSVPIQEYLQKILMNVLPTNFSLEEML